MLHTPPRDLAWGLVGGFGLPSLPSPSASSTRSRKPACVCRVFYRESACHASASEIGRCAWFAGISDIPCQSQQVPISTFMTCHGISPTIARPDVSLSESTNSAMSLPNQSRPVIRVGKLMRHGLLCHYTCGGKESNRMPISSPCCMPGCHTRAVRAHRHIGTCGGCLSVNSCRWGIQPDHVFTACGMDGWRQPQVPACAWVDGGRKDWRRFPKPMGQAQ